MEAVGISLLPVMTRRAGLEEFLRRKFPPVILQKIPSEIFSKLRSGENLLASAPREGLAGLKTMPNGRFGPGPKGARKGDPKLSQKRSQNGVQNGAKIEPFWSSKTVKTLVFRVFSLKMDPRRGAKMEPK